MADEVAVDEGVELSNAVVLDREDMISRRFTSPRLLRMCSSPRCLEAAVGLGASVVGAYMPKSDRVVQLGVGPGWLVHPLPLPDRARGRLGGTIRKVGLICRDGQSPLERGIDTSRNLG